MFKAWGLGSGSWLQGLSGSVEREDPGRRSKIFQNLYVTCGLKMLMVPWASCAILYIAWSSDFSLWLFSNK